MTKVITVDGVTYTGSDAVELTIQNNPPTNPLGFQFESAKQVQDPRLKKLPVPAISGARSSSFASNTVQGAASITEMARALAGSATGSTAVGQIFEFVYNNIEWEPGWGVQKGALGSLMDGMGNSFDQSLLLANLLRSAGFTANIVLGTIRLFEVDYQAWWNVNDIFGAQSYCLNEFIPIATVPTWNGVTYYMDIKHVWCQVVISGTTYVLDPSRKTYTRKTGLASATLGSALGYNATTFMNDAKSGATVTADYTQKMNRGNIRSDLNTYTSNLVSYINANTIGSATPGTATVDDVLGGQTINPVSLPLSLSTSLSYEAPGDVPTVWTGDVPAAYKPTLQVQFPNWSNPGVWDFTYSNTSDNLAATRLTLWYDVSLVPSLYLNGSVVATGLAQPGGTFTSIFLTVSHPAYDASNYPLAFQQNYQTTWQWWQSSIFAGSSYLVANAWGNLGRGQMDYHANLVDANIAAGGSSTSEAVLGEKMSVTWFRWVAQNSRICDLINRFRNCHTMYSHQVGMVSFEQSLYSGTDLGGVVGSSTNLANDTTQTPPNDTLLAMHGVALEAGTVEQMIGSLGGSSTTTVIDEINRTVRGTLGGTVTAGNMLSVTVTDSGLPGGAQIVSYTVIGGDTLTTIATGIANAVNANSNLTNLGISANASGTVFNLFSLSPNTTTYSASNGGGTETITLAYDKVYKTTSSNWSAGTNVQSILLANGYNSTDLTDLNNWYISIGDSVVIGDHPSTSIATWSGWGYWAYPTAGAYGIINGGFKGAKKKGEQDKKNPKDPKKGKTEGDPVSLFTGSFLTNPTDFDVGSQEEPYKLSFGRSYDSSAQYLNGVLGRGWNHSHNINANVSSDGFLAMGQQYAVPACATIANLFVCNDLLGDTTRPVEKLVAATLSDAWWVDQIVNNAVVVSYPDTTNYIFIKQPDGSFTRPVNFPNKLTLVSGLYVLTTPQGVKTNFNSSGQISSVVYPNGVTVSYTYSSGVLSSISNGLGRTLTLNYTSGKLTSVTDGNGRSVSYIVDGSSNLTQFTDSNSKNTTYSYDQPGRMTQIFYPAFPATAFITNVYDSLSRVKTQANARSQVTTFYLAGPRSEVLDPVGNKNITYFNQFGSTTSEIDALSNKTDTLYDGLNRAIKVTLPEGNYTQNAFDMNDNVLTITKVAKSGSGLGNIVLNNTFDSTWAKIKTEQDGNGNTTTYGYDATTGNLLTIQRPAVSGQTPLVTMKWNSRGQQLSRIDETGIQTQFVYDVSTEKLTSSILNTNWTCSVGGTITVGNVLTITAFDAGLSGGQKSISYTVLVGDTLAKAATGLAAAVNADTSLAALGIVGYANNAVVSLSTSPGNTTTFTGSTSVGATETLTLAAGKNLTVSFGYNSVGDITGVTDANSNQVTFQFDNMRMLMQRTEPSPFSYITNFGFDDDGNLTSQQRQIAGVPAWQTRSFTYSATGKKLTEVDPFGRTTTWTFDGADRLQTITDAQGRQWQYAYDALNRISTVTDPTSTITDTRTYTNNGKLASVKDVRNNTTQYTWDGFDRANKTIYADTTFEQNSSYDSNGNVLTYLTRSGNSIVSTFDALNRLSTKAPTGQPTVTYTFDLAGRLIQASKPVVAGDPSSGALSFSFDSAGRFIQEQYPDGKTVTHVLDNVGNQTKTTYPDGYFISRVFDQMNRLTDIKLNGSGSAAAHFDYNELSQRTKLTYSNGTTVVYNPRLNDDITGITHNFVGSTLNLTFGFNNVNEPLGASYSDGLYIWHPSGAFSVTYGTADSVNKYPTVGGLTYSYDGNKNLTGDGGTWTYTFDSENHLLTANATGTSASMVYDPIHRQSQKTVGSVKSRYVYSGWQRIADYDGVSGSLQTRYVYGVGLDEPLIAVSSGGTLTFLHHGRMGCIIATSDGSSGAVTNKNQFSPFGEIATLAGTTFGLTGQRYDSELGLYYYKLRYYSPKLGRFLQPDPIGYTDEDFNLYTYVGNSPLKFTDPMGLDKGDKSPKKDPPKGEKLQPSNTEPQKPCKTCKGGIGQPLQKGNDTTPYEMRYSEDNRPEWIKNLFKNPE